MIYELTGVQQVYGQRTVLDLDLTVQEGDVLALVGPSGAGKSTLLRLMNFLETPSSGTISYCGRPVASDAPLAMRREVTMVFQHPVLLHATVRDNVAYGLRLRGQPADGAVDAMLHEVGLSNLARHPAHTLSGGEMQRVALARALVVRPRVLLLDEPTANLDPYNVGMIEDIIRRSNSERSTTVVLVTHNVFQAHRLARRTGLLLGGRLVEIAPTGAFFTAPSDPRTAAFVRGDMVY